MLGTPNFGTSLANQLGNDNQTAELETGSQFLFDLNTWNQGTDDLRGVDALAILGIGGTGTEFGIQGFHDGVVTAISASIAFASPAHSRVIRYCDTPSATAHPICQRSRTLPAWITTSARPSALI
jgi:hypothetical protein